MRDFLGAQLMPSACKRGETGSIVAGWLSCSTTGVSRHIFCMTCLWIDVSSEGGVCCACGGVGGGGGGWGAGVAVFFFLMKPHQLCNKASKCQMTSKSPLLLSKLRKNT